MNIKKHLDYLCFSAMYLIAAALFWTFMQSGIFMYWIMNGDNCKKEYINPSIVINYVLYGKSTACSYIHMKNRLNIMVKELKE